MNYYYDNSSYKALKNLENSESLEVVNKLERFYVNKGRQKLDEIDVYKQEYNLETLKMYHKTLLGKLYEWAGELRQCNMAKQEEILNGKSVEYGLVENIEKQFNQIHIFMEKEDFSYNTLEEKSSKVTAYLTILWKNHTFRDGNTRTHFLFVRDFAKSKGVSINRDYIFSRMREFRDNLVIGSIGNTVNLKEMIKKAIEEDYKNIEQSPKEIVDKCEEVKTEKKDKESLKGIIFKGENNYMMIVEVDKKENKIDCIIKDEITGEFFKVNNFGESIDLMGNKELIGKNMKEFQTYKNLIGEKNRQEVLEEREIYKLEKNMKEYKIGTITEKEIKYRRFKYNKVEYSIENIGKVGEENKIVAVIKDCRTNKKYVENDFAGTRPFKLNLNLQLAEDGKTIIKLDKKREVEKEKN